MSDRVTFDEADGSAPADPKKHFLVVGLGGSAGSITSFREFFRQVPADSGMAYVVILHLSPDHDSRLAEVLQAVTRLPVLQVREAVKVQPDHVYVIPPNRGLAMDDGMLVLSSITSYEERRAPIDIFFRTLATHHDSRAVCVVMSGSGSDGAMGLRRVKEYNGLALVQDPAEATFGEMPRHSIATGLVDFVVPAAEMPQRIIYFRDQLRALERTEDTVAGLANDEQSLMEIFTILRLRTGHDFINYKRPTVLRRIERRMAIRDVVTLPGYAMFLRDRNEEAHALLNELLISVTNFFRDREVWERIERELLPKLLAAKGTDEHLRVWVPGCATGEEAYTVAMLLAEKAAPNVQIFATDLDEHAIARARDGWYAATEVADVPPERLQRFFLRDGDGYCVRRDLREMVLFAHHNLIKDPPFSHLDFISCRNLLIYLNRSAQQRALEVMHFALNRGGYLLLGTAEAADGAPNLFSVVQKEAHLFQGRPVERVPVLAPLPRAVAAVDPSALMATAEAPPVESRPRERFAGIDLHHRLLEQYAPPSIVVDDQQNIVHLSDRGGRYLQHPRGEATTNVLQLIRQELRIDLRSALFQAAQKRTTVAARNVSVHTGERTERIDLVVRPALEDDVVGRGLFLIVFEEASDGGERPAHDAAAVEPGTVPLEEELVRLKAQMRGTIEQHEIQAEEAKAANEELQAMNEELRSTAEELETSQEELQSVNEELQTVNQELKVKIDEISHTSDDLRNLMISTDIGTIFVDRSLRVKLFTPRARQVFNLIPADVGRPLSDITNKLVIDGFADEMARVLDRLHTIEREVQTRDGAWYLMRLLPYRTSEDRIDGVVLTFLEITERHSAETALRASETRYRTLFETIDQGLCTIEVGFDDAGNPASYRLIEVNPASEQQIGIVNAAGRPLREIAPLNEESWLAAYARVATTGEQERFESEVPGLGRWFDVSAYGVGDPALHRVGILFSDITERRQVAERLRRAAALDAFRVKLNDAIGSLSDSAALRDAATRIIGESLQADRILYVELTRDGETFVAHDNFVRGNFPAVTGQYPVGRYPTATARLRSGELLRIDDISAEPGLSADEKAAFAGLGIAATISVPLIKRGQLLSTLSAHHGTPYHWTDEQIDLLREAAERTSAAVERSRAETALRESEEKFRTLFESMDEGYILCDVLFDDAGRAYDIRYLEANPAAVRMTGAELVGRTTREISADFEEHWFQAWGRVAVTGVAERHEYFAEPLNAYYNFYVFKVGPPESRRVAAIYEDVTDRRRAVAALRESESRLQTITNLVPDLLWISESDGQATWHNRRWLDYTGQSAEEALGWGWTAAIHPEEREQAAENYRRALAAGRPLQQEQRIRSAAGEYRWFLINALPSRDEEGNVIRYYGAATDVDDQRAARERLEERVRERTQELLELSVSRQQLLEQLVTATEEERRRIARELHDEMGQHTTALRVRLESLAPRDGVEELKTIIGHIDRSIDRLAMELRLQALDQLGVNGAITALADDFSAATGIHVSLHLGLLDDERFPSAVESALYRAVQESLTNVWKHAGATTVSVIVERDRDALRMIVEDNGRGFDAQGVDRAATAHGRFGLLGMRERLALVRGTLDIESEPGSGATIYIRVPLAKAPESAS